ncbi:MAG TPA: hypothetical protein VH024_15350 [Candidatus Angelobacter sp.]|nr:hypothetical protein [Candidatus Angelobacter sp.]
MRHREDRSNADESSSTFFDGIFFAQQRNFVRAEGNSSRFSSAAVTTAIGWASIPIDMKLQKETKKEPRKTARLNRLVFGVALLWLATSLLLLLMYHSGPAHAVQPNRASQAQKLALVAPPAAANASFT